MEILRVENLSFTYPEATAPALTDVSFSLSLGDFVTVCGSTGSGKTTLLKLLKKEIAPVGSLYGTVVLGGDIKSTDIGFVFQDPESQTVTDTVISELSFGLENVLTDKELLRRRVAETAGYFSLESILHSDVSSLSSGQKQLLSLASVTAMLPKILILDEPTARLDPIARENFIDTLYKLNRENGITVIAAEHNLKGLLEISDKVITVENGKAEMFPSVSEFLSESGKNNRTELLPTIPRVFSSRSYGNIPLTVKDGIRKLETGYTFLPIKEKNRQSHSDITAIKVKHGYFRYEKDGKDILSDINIEVKKGEVFSLVGANGSGKTTLLKVLCGINRLFSGSIEIFSVKPKKITDFADVGYLPQNPKDLFFSDKVSDDFSGICKDESRIASLSDKFGITHLLERHPYDLSGGELQTAAMVKLLLADKKILLLDEPTKAIDYKGISVLKEVISELKKEEITIITVTHDTDFAASISDRAAFLFDGSTVSEETPDSFFGNNGYYTTDIAKMTKGNAERIITEADFLSRVKYGGEV